MKQIIKRILSEQYNSDYLEKVSRSIDIPYFRMMEDHFNVTDPDDQLEVLKYIYGNDISILCSVYDFIYNSNGDVLYKEDSFGRWGIWDRDTNGNCTYYENSDGEWEKNEYDEKGNPIFFETEDGYWVIQKYDENGKMVYYENSNGEIEDYRK